MARFFRSSRSGSAACAALLVFLAACGGGSGGGSSSTGAVNASPAASASGSTPPPTPPGPNIFLLFPNPQKQSDGTLQTNTSTYAQSYYAAIDPMGQRDTLDHFKSVNGIGSGVGTDLTFVFADTRDLGYGRRLTAHRNPDGTLAFVVENFLVGGLSNYGTADTDLNLAAAMSDDTRWRVEVNAIEFSPAPQGTVSFPKFFVYDTNTLQQSLTGTLDNRGPKSMPSVCISCHGGRGDPLTPPDPTNINGLPRFPLVADSVSQARGDVQARLQPLNVDRVVFASSGAWSRAAQEANLKTLNEWLLCSYPISATAKLTAGPEDACRRDASINEWQGDTVASFLKAAYGGTGLPNATFSDTYVDPSWLSNGQSTLYASVVKDQCRVCHQLRGTGNQSDLDLSDYTKFSGYTDRIKVHGFDRGNMPLALILYDVFAASGANAPRAQLATYLSSQGYDVFDSSGNPLAAGRPVADPGPDRTVRQGAVQLSAAMSLYATSYQWSIVSGPANGATLTDATTATPTFTSSVDGSYVVRLVASNGTTSSAPTDLLIVVNNALTPDPAAIRWADVKAILQNPADCASCHYQGGPAPIVYTDIDRNGDGNVQAGPGQTDDFWEYTEVRGRINFTDLVASPLLRKPSGHHHNGGLRPLYDNTLTPGDPNRAHYDLVLNWILNGAPYQ